LSQIFHGQNFSIIHDADLFGSFQYFYLIIGLNIRVLPRI